MIPDNSAPFQPTNPDVADAANAAVIEIALAERLRALTVHAARIERLALDYEVPMSTLRAAVAQGRGPKTFTIGRLIYCRRGDWITWLDGLAETGGTGPLSPPAGRRPAARQARAA
jgi:hypothetical protein